jgi:hypothetical protein
MGNPRLLQPLDVQLAYFADRQTAHSAEHVGESECGQCRVFHSMAADRGLRLTTLP